MVQTACSCYTVYNNVTLMLSELKEKIRVSVQSHDLLRKFLAWKLPVSLTVLALVFGETISTSRSLPLPILVFHNTDLTGRDRRQCYDIHLFRNLTSYFTKNKVVSITKIHAAIAGCRDF